MLRRYLAENGMRLGVARKAYVWIGRRNKMHAWSYSTNRLCCQQMSSSNRMQFETLVGWRF